MKLRHDPYQVFRFSKTPAGLYARQKWLGEAEKSQTLNALAHLDLPQADHQIKTAFNRLVENQNIDGSWGRSEPEWNTFLAIHALRNKGLL